MFKKILQSKWFGLVPGLALLGLGFSLYQLYHSYQAVGLEANNLQAKIAQAQKATAALAQQNANADNPAFLERQARLRLNYKKPDENVVFVYRDQYNQNSNQTASTAPAEEPKWYQQLWEWVRAKFK